MKPYDTIGEETTVEIIAFDIDKPEMLVWRCTEQQGNDWNEITDRVKSQGYSMFEKRTTTVKNEFFDLDEQ